MSRTRTAAIGAGVAALVVVLLGLQAGEAIEAAWLRGFVREAEETAAFVRRALPARGDLLVAERFGELARRDGVAYVLILDPRGRARFHGDPASVGKTYDSPYAKRALVAAGTILQDIPEAGVVEVDVPLGDGSVLRMGGSAAALAGGLRWMWTALGAAAAALVTAGFMAARTAR